MELEGDKRASSGLSESDDVNNKFQSDSPKHPNLSDAQRAKIERNRQKALLLRQARLTSRPYPTEKPSRKSDKPEVSGIKVSGRLIDTGAGFLLEEETEDEKNQESLKIVEQPDGDNVKPQRVLTDAPIIDNRPRCEECGNLFSESFLLNHYDVDICDTCRDNEERHALITKTDAKQHYLLKDCDFDKREPPLKFIVRKNPHNARWGDMRLFLKSQVEARALQVWGSKEKIEEQKEKRSVNKEKLKQKKFDKKMKELRREVRSSLWTKDISSHEHTYGEETYNEESDMYSKSCTSCGHHLTYEKM